jgi:hypothetical protein
MQGAPLLSRGRRWLGIFGGRFTPWLARSTTSPRELNAARITCGSLERRLVVASQSASSSSPQLCRTAEQRDELASLHSITSSVRASSVGGTSRPSALAVLRLIARLYLVAAWTGRSAGFSPLSMRSM